MIGPGVVLIETEVGSRRGGRWGDETAKPPSTKGVTKGCWDLRNVRGLLGNRTCRRYDDDVNTRFAVRKSFASLPPLSDIHLPLVFRIDLVTATVLILLGVIESNSEETNFDDLPPFVRSHKRYPCAS